MSEQKKISRATLQPQQSISDADPRGDDRAYTWQVGDVFKKGQYRWAVDSVHGDRAVLRSCDTSWATTMPLTFNEWREGGRWQLEEPSSGPRYCYACDQFMSARECKACGMPTEKAPRA